MIVARLGSKAVRRILQRIADQAAARSGSQRTGARMSTMSALAANLWRFFVFVIAVAIILGMLGVNLTPLLASATIIGATLGFGAQLIIRDYLSGFLLTVEDQYGIGDTRHHRRGDRGRGGPDAPGHPLAGRRRDRLLRGQRRHPPVGQHLRGWAHAVVDLTLPGILGGRTASRPGRPLSRRHGRWPDPRQFAAHCTEPPNLVTLVDSTEDTLTLRVTLNSVPSQRDALTRALREEAVVELNRAQLWPAPSD